MVCLIKTNIFVCPYKISHRAFPKRSIRPYNSSMPPCYRLNLLSGFQLLHDGQVMSGLHAPRLQALLAYLAVNRRTPQPRQQVAFLMWPDAAEAQARTNLRKAIHSLRQVIPLEA